MKAFEKWLNYSIQMDRYYCDDIDNGDTYAAVAELAWRAALEYIRSEMGRSYWMNDVGEIIDKELDQ